LAICCKSILIFVFLVGALVVNVMSGSFKARSTSHASSSTTVNLTYRLLEGLQMNDVDSW
jgi:hypothetical protein